MKWYKKCWIKSLKKMSLYSWQTGMPSWGGQQRKQPTLGPTDWVGRGVEMRERRQIGGVLHDKQLNCWEHLLQHHRRRLWTWSSPGDRVRNQIDYIMIGRRLQNVKTRPGADCGSDHQLLAAKFRLKFKACQI